MADKKEDKLDPLENESQKQNEEVPHTSGYVTIIVVLLICMMFLIFFLNKNNEINISPVRTLAIDRLVYFNITKENLLWRIDCDQNISEDTYGPVTLRDIPFFITGDTTEFINIKSNPTNPSFEYVDRLRYSELISRNTLGDIMNPYLDENHTLAGCFVKARTQISYKIYDEGNIEKGSAYCYIDGQGPFSCGIDKLKFEETGIKYVICSGTLPTEETLKSAFVDCLKGWEK